MKWNDLENVLQRAMKPLRDRVLLLAGRAILTAVNDSENMQFVQLKALAGESLDKIRRFQEFGFTSNPPSGTEAIMISLGGNRENAVIIATDHRQYRFKPLQSGESAIYTDDGTYIVLKKAGEVEIKTATHVNIDVPDATFTGNLLVKGNAVIEGDETVEGNSTVEGDAEVQGLTTLVQDVACGANVAVTGVVAAGGFTGPAGGPMTSTVDIQTSANVIGGGTDLAMVKSTFNAHTHQENGTGGGVTNPPSTPL